MRMSGDLIAARRRHPTFLPEGLRAARELRLPEAIAAFSAGAGWIETQFFVVFDPLCRELRASEANRQGHEPRGESRAGRHLKSIPAGSSHG